MSTAKVSLVTRAVARDGGRRSLFRIRELIQELAQREYSNVLIRFQIEHSPIARDDDVGMACHGTLENAAMRLVLEDGQLTAGSHEFGQV